MNAGFQWSPKGALVLFADRGPGGDGSEAAQLVTLDVRTGARKQVTRFGAASQDEGTLVEGVFLGDGTISGFSGGSAFTVKSDGSGFRAFDPPTPIPGSKVVPNFQRAGQIRQAQVLALPTKTTVPFAGDVREIFVSDGGNVLQLTSFGRADTVAVATLPGDERVVLAASADPFGRNPLNVCQLFSIDRFGGNLRQLTAFGSGEVSPVGCFKATAPPSCRIDVTDTLLDVGTPAHGLSRHGHRAGRYRDGRAARPDRVLGTLGAPALAPGS